MRIDKASFANLNEAAGHSSGRELVASAPVRSPFRTAEVSASTAASATSSKLREAAGGIDIRHASPREIADLGLDLHLAGYLDWDEYALVAFQPELHPDFDSTVGALTGIYASPDRPRDQLGLWEERLSFERRYPAKDPTVQHRTERVVAVFRQLDRPLDVSA